MSSISATQSASVSNYQPNLQALANASKNNATAKPAVADADHDGDSHASGGLDIKV